jgi:hypothetical protein
MEITEYLFTYSNHWLVKSYLSSRKLETAEEYKIAIQDIRVCIENAMGRV